MSLPLMLYKTAFRLATPFVEKHLQTRAAQGKEDLQRAPERRGIAAKPRGTKPLVWFHGASVGESLSLLVIIRALAESGDDVDIMITTGTVTSAKLMQERLPAGCFHQYMPVDHPLWVARFLDHWTPDMVIWTESDLWPNMLSGIKARNIPAVLINARMSEPSFKKWQRAKNSAAEILSAFHLCLAQNDAEASRLTRLGHKNVKVVANLKYASAPLPDDADKRAALHAAIGERPFVTWASTHPGEEDAAVRLHNAQKQQTPGLLSVIIPRQPARGPDLKKQYVAQGLSVGLRAAGELPAPEHDLYIADTIGEMGIFYRLADLVVIGGSFANTGGQNPIEPAQLDCVIFYGPTMFNFIGISHDFETRKAALPLRDEDDLHKNVAVYFQNPENFAPLRRAAKEWTSAQAHVITETMGYLRPYLDGIKARAAGAQG